MENVELYYEVLNASVLLPWMLMILLPTWWFTQKIVNTFIFSVFFSAVYIAIILYQFNAITDGNFNTLAGLKILFSNDWLILLGWVHYLAFDLVVGSLILRDAQQNEYKHWHIIPFLSLSFLLGPCGWFGYWIYRSIRQKSFYFN